MANVESAVAGMYPTIYLPVAALLNSYDKIINSRKDLECGINVKVIRYYLIVTSLYLLL